MTEHQRPKSDQSIWSLEPLRNQIPSFSEENVWLLMLDFLVVKLKSLVVGHSNPGLLTSMDQTYQPSLVGPSTSIPRGEGSPRPFCPLCNLNLIWILHRLMDLDFGIASNLTNHQPDWLISIVTMFKVILLHWSLPRLHLPPQLCVCILFHNVIPIRNSHMSTRSFLQQFRLILSLLDFLMLWPLHISK